MRKSNRVIRKILLSLLLISPLFLYLSVVSIIQVTASTVTAIGVVIAAIQLWLIKRQAVTTFEDEVSNEYRQIAKPIPVQAMLGEDLKEEEFNRALNEIYNYIDFTNEQIFLRQQGRIRKTTWQNWCEGIDSNLDLPAFKKAWKLVKEKLPHSFNELRRLEAEGFRIDPKKWEKSSMS